MRSVSVALGVLEAVARHQPVGVSELARVMDLPKSTAQRMLLTLGSLGWIRSSGEEPTRWSITEKAWVVGMAHRPGDELMSIARPTMHSLAAETGETIHLSVVVERSVMLVDKIDSANPVRTHTYVGGRAPLHTAASGKAILAAMPPEQAEALLRAEPLVSLTDDTEVEVPALLTELDGVRKQGYAVTVGTRHREVAAIAAAIRGLSGEPVAALSVSMPIHRLGRRQQPVIGEQVRLAAEECSARLGSPPAGS